MSSSVDTSYDTVFLSVSTCGPAPVGALLDGLRFEARAAMEMDGLRWPAFYGGARFIVRAETRGSMSEHDALSMVMGACLGVLWPVGTEIARFTHAHEEGDPMVEMWAGVSKEKGR